MKVEIGNATRIYALCDPLTGEVRYVGKTIRSLRQRLMQHRIASRKGALPVNRWMRKHHGVNLTGPYIKLLEIVPNGFDWAEREKAWISKFGQRLLNLTNGGEGLSGHVFTDEHKAKISAKLRTGAWKRCLQCDSSFWRKKNEIKKGMDKYCCKKCYQLSQTGKPKPNKGAPLAAIKASAKAKRDQVNCKRGHPLSGDNLFFTSKGGRGCKECRKIHKSTYLEKLK